LSLHGLKCSIPDTIIGAYIIFFAAAAQRGASDREEREDYYDYSR
jgi:hypothetical protein